MFPLITEALAWSYVLFVIGFALRSEFIEFLSDNKWPNEKWFYF